MSPLFAMCIFVGALFCGLTLDLASVERTRLHMQDAADAAAMGAQVSHDQDDPNWITNGKSDAALNGFTDGVNNTTVTVIQNPTSGAYAGQYDAVQATITQKLSTSFMGILGIRSSIVTAQATALMTPCVYTTGAHGFTGLTQSLNLTVGSSIGVWGGSVMGCPVYAANGIQVDTYSSLWTNATNVIGASGSSSVTGGVFHAPHYNAQAQADPLVYQAACATLNSNCEHGSASGVSAPSFSSCSYTNKSWTTGSSLSPGTYCNSFNFSGVTVSLSPGLYIITGGATWTNSTVSGSGVTLYFTQKGDGNYGKFVVTNSNLSISAPSTSSNSSIPGILVMNDPNWVPTTAQDFQFLGYSASTGDGIFYLVGTGLKISSSTLSATHYLAFDVDNLLEISSALSPKSNFTSLATGNPFFPMGSLVQ